jgi:ribosomal protein S18 acetylase RimI-like enzyme
VDTRIVDQTITYLEMRSPDDLVPGRPPPEPMELEHVDAAAVGTFHAAVLRIGEPHDWTTPSGRSEDQWRARLARPQVRAWIAGVGGEVAGVIELELHAEGEVEITMLGLVPEMVGRGFGGHLLTLATRLAWEARLAGDGPNRRVWLHTSSLDHPHALLNYERRGFRVFRTERRPRPIGPQLR